MHVDITRYIHCFEGILKLKCPLLSAEIKVENKMLAIV